jgi:glucosamine-6-phosphate deaminase
LLATGRDKAGIVRRALSGPITTRVPASMLQLHPNVLVVLDRAAAALVS